MRLITPELLINEIGSRIKKNIWDVSIIDKTIELKCDLYDVVIDVGSVKFNVSVYSLEDEFDSTKKTNVTDPILVIKNFLKETPIIATKKSRIDVLTILKRVANKLALRQDLHLLKDLIENDNIKNGIKTNRWEYVVEWDHNIPYIIVGIPEIHGPYNAKISISKILYNCKFTRLEPWPGDSREGWNPVIVEYMSVDDPFILFKKFHQKKHDIPSRSDKTSDDTILEPTQVNALIDDEDVISRNKVPSFLDPKPTIDLRPKK